MFVDKTLVGLAAVQTLSRLNRIHPEKTDTFVLDFRNEVEAITESFAPWYETTVAAPTDPNLLHDLAGKLHALQVLSDLEVRQAAAILADRTPKADYHAALHATLDPAVDRFAARMPGDQTEIRDLLDRYVRAYSFLSQVVDFGDVWLEALYLAGRAFVSLLPTDRGGSLDLGSEVQLTHLRLEKTSEGSIGPSRGVGELKSIYDGQGKQTDEERERLSAIIQVLNDRFGMALGPADQLFFDQMEATWLGDPQLVAQARANPIENFKLVFADAFIKSIVGRMDDNADIFKRILDEPAFQAVVMEHYLERVFAQARALGEYPSA